jgi:hypothetical protein
MKCKRSAIPTLRNCKFKKLIQTNIHDGRDEELKFADELAGTQIFFALNRRHHLKGLAIARPFQV